MPGLVAPALRRERGGVHGDRLRVHAVRLPVPVMECVEPVATGARVELRDEAVERRMGSTGVAEVRAERVAQAGERDRGRQTRDQAVEHAPPRVAGQHGLEQRARAVEQRAGLYGWCRSGYRVARASVAVAPGAIAS